MGPQSISWLHQLRSGFPIPPKSVVQRLLRVPKHLFVVERNVVPQDVKSRPGQFMSQGPVGSSRMFLLPQFTLVKLSTGLMKNSGPLGGLTKSPGQVLVSIFLVTVAFDFFITCPPAVHLPTIGGITAHFGKTFDGTRFQHEGRSHNPAHPRKGQQLGVRSSQDQFLYYCGLDPTNLSAQNIDGGFTGRASQQEIFIVL